MQTRKASIKETGEELTPAEWERFDAAVADLKAERRREPDQPHDEQPENSGRSDQVVA